jgi:murein DD-endopeptidase MepM/ murein hydrolase activator NlpD
VVQWLQQNQAGFAPVIGSDLATPDAALIDLSSGSLALSDMSVLRDVGRFERWVVDRLAEAGAKVGIGRYNEPRLVYSEGHYLVERDWIRESRTIHLGIDLFATPGTPVFTPIDGVIHSLANNDRRQDYGPTIILEHKPPSTTEPFFTLYGHLSLDSIAGLEPGRPVRRGERIGRIGDSCVNGGWPPHLHLQVIADMLSRVGIRLKIELTEWGQWIDRVFRTQTMTSRSSGTQSPLTSTSTLTPTTIFDTTALSFRRR